MQFTSTAVPVQVFTLWMVYLLQFCSLVRSLYIPQYLQQETRDICVTVCLNKKIFLIHYQRVQTWFHMLIAALWTELDEKKGRLILFFFEPRLSTTKNNYFSQLLRYNWLLLFYLIYVRIIITVIILDYFMHNKWAQTVCGVISMLGYVPW